MLLISIDPRVPWTSSATPFQQGKTSGQSNLTKSASRGPIPQLGITPGGQNLYRWIPGVGVPISVT